MGQVAKKKNKNKNKCAMRCDFALVASCGSNDFAAAKAEREERKGEARIKEMGGRQVEGKVMAATGETRTHVTILLCLPLPLTFILTDE